MRILSVLLIACGVALTARAAPAAPQTGDHHENDALAQAGGMPMIYRVYTPTTWRPGVSMPLVIILHGYGGTADGTFDRAPPALAGVVQHLAELHGFIVAAPQGYNSKADYGADLPLPHRGAVDVTTPASRAASALAEIDVMTVRARMLAQYGADPRRVYLMGNSMGMTGVLNLAKNHPGDWCAIAPSDGPPWPGYPVDRLRDLSGAIVVNGEKDTIAMSADNRALSERMKAAGIDTRFVEVPGGVHSDSWYIALPEIFAFFDRHRCGG